MGARSATDIEKGVDRAASALFAVAAGYAGYAWFAAHAAPPLPLAEACGLAAFAYLLSVRGLQAIEPEARRMSVPIFDVRHMDEVEPDELLLTERYQPAPPVREEPLVLDDVLAEIQPDFLRVVRLFDPAAMPTPGQLNARIEQHLAADTAQAGSHDASQALHDALAELRRSLR